MKNASPQSPYALNAAESPVVAAARLGSSLTWSRVICDLTVLAIVFFGVGVLFQGNRNGHASDARDTEIRISDPFAKWPREKPALALVFSGQSIGYLQPCGCSDPQYGGLARRFSFIQSLKDKGWNVAAMDIGDIGTTHGPQALLKYRTAMRALEAMKYSAVGLGKNEFLMPLSTALGEHSLNNPKPRILAANLVETGPGGFWNKHNVHQTEVVEVGGLKVGIVAIIGPTLMDEVKKGLSEEDKKLVDFVDPARALSTGLLDLKSKGVHVGVLLFGGTEEEAIPFVVAAEKQRQKDRTPLLYAALCQDKFSDPGDLPSQVPGIHTQLISLGHKGKNVGVLGFFRTPKGTELRYARVQIGPEFQPRDGDEKTNPVLAVMQEYADELKRKDYLSPRMTPRSVHSTQTVVANARYIGSEKCASCHEHADTAWQATRHSHAYETLESVKFPTGRQYDPECIVCHTVGFKHKTGFADPAPGLDAKKIKKHNELMHGVGCESCHGPGSAHANNPADLKLRELINPFRPSDEELDARTSEAKKDQLFDRRMKLIEWNQCMKCHDEENDVHWGTVGFRTKYVKGGIIHNTPMTGRGFQAWQAAEQRARDRAAAAAAPAKSKK